jgi:hypothetical protein
MTNLGNEVKDSEKLQTCGIMRARLAKKIEDNKKTNTRRVASSSPG